MKMKRLSSIFVILPVVFFLLTSCAPMGREAAEYGDFAESDAPMASKSSEDMLRDGAAPVSESNAGNSGGAESSEDDTRPDVDVSGSRKRIYNGSAGLVVESVEDTRGALESLTRDSGGYVESSFSEYLVLRVPAGQFDQVFDQILTMGQVEFSRVETWDVTEAFADNERLLKTAEDTRARLYVLLERSKDPAERARILKEIGRLTEEIQSLKQKLSILASRVSFSRITVQLTPRIQGDYSRADIPFPWIAGLDPLIPAGSKLRGKVNLDLGDDFAVFTKESVFMAEDSGGNHITISTVENEPEGDSAFWQKALSFHLGPYYSETKDLSLQFGKQPLSGVELVSKDREPFRYFVGIISDGSDLHVIEIFSPDSEKQFDDYYQALSKGELK
jgi:hypothetical protein